MKDIEQRAMATQMIETTRGEEKRREEVHVQRCHFAFWDATFSVRIHSTISTDLHPIISNSSKNYPPPPINDKGKKHLI